MAEEKDREQAKGQGAAASAGGGTNKAGDPGRTPDQAEGDEQTVDEALRRQENK